VTEYKVKNSVDRKVKRMTQAKNGDTVKIHYTGKFEDGTEFATSINDDPLQFTIGEGQAIPGLEQAVIGMSPGESKTAEILAAQAYGPYQKSKVREVNRGQFPPHLNLQVGKVLTTRKANGDKVRHIVTTLTMLN
jgi:FKBP-type peptidyl-prolyl cis-trans isomerase 2